MEPTVNKKASLPASVALCTFMPKPNPTTENFNRTLVALWLSCKKGWPVRLAKSIPKSKAMGGETNEVVQANRHNTKTSCLWTLLILEYFFLKVMLFDSIKKD